MKNIVLVFILTLLVSMAYSQKKQLNHDVYDSWENLSSFKISDNGEYSAYQVNPQKGDGRLVLVENKLGNEIASFERGVNQLFSASGDFVVFKVKVQADTIRNLKIQKENEENYPKDSLFIYSLKNKIIKSYPRVKSYKIAQEENDIVCFLHEKELKDSESDSLINNEEQKDTLKSEKKALEGTKLVLINLVSDESVEYENVSEYVLSENGKLLVYKSEIKDSIDTVSIHIVNTKTFESKTLINEAAYISKLSIDKYGRRFAFYYSQDTAEDKLWQIMLFEAGEGEIATLSSQDVIGINKDWKISKEASLRFSEDESNLYFGTTFDIEEVKKDSIPADEIAHVDIWSWTDGRIMPHQIKRLDDDKKKSFAAVYNIDNNKAHQIADSMMDKVSLKTRAVQYDVTLGYTDIPYQERIQWSMDTFRDYFIVNVNSGKKTKLAKDFNGSVSLAPGGKFATLYSKQDSTWYIYDVLQKLSYPMTEDVDVKFYNDESEIPALPSHWGIAGWLKNDRGVIVYDKYDMWLLTCGKGGSAQNLTNEFGRKNEIVLRYVKTDKDAFYVDDNKNILVKGFNKNTKDESLYFMDLKTGKLDLLMEIPYSISGVTKAKYEEKYVYRKSDYNTYPDVFVVNNNQNWNNAKKISAVNTQQEDYLWGTAEMYEWTDFNGDTVSGLLYKPDNFDPNKKYPMVVYFYEKYSDGLHYHYTPKPSRSVISFPLFTSKGYVVFIPDIHYLTGQPGKDAYNSIVSGTYSLIEKGFINKDKIGIQGQSWGGYQVAYLVTQTDLYACAMAGAPVSNMTSAYGGIRYGSGQSRMMQYEEGQSRIGGTLWESLPEYIENSPVFYADRINTPLLIMHNDGDGAVPFTQGVELFVAMKRLGKPAWLLNYNGEEHNLKGRANCKDLSNRMTDFFDFYLMDAGNPDWLINGAPAIYKGKK